MRLKSLKALGKPTAAAEQAAPVACAAGPVGPATSTPVLDLFPVPSAIILWDGECLQFEAVNQAFRRSGLGHRADQSLLIDRLGDRIRAFIESDQRNERFDWQTPESVDSRFYSVTLARRDVSLGHGRCLATLIDRTAERRTEDNLRREMMTDSLTGLPNRAGFADLLEDTHSSLGGERLAVLVVNLDRFSRVNACMGGIVGDELLISVARRLKGALRARDWLARIGGDEFAILMQLDDGMSDALQVARRIENALATPFRLSDFDIRVSCSIGIALGEPALEDSENLIRHAQFAGKRSKKTGKVEIYATRALDVARAQFSIETELRRALDHGELVLNFQPIADLASGRIVSFESLARWTNRDGMEIPPSQFIPVAEEAGLIVPLGRWAMAEALRTLAEWDKAAGGDCGVQVAVNVSAIQLQRDQVAPLVEQMLAANGLAGERLTLELTESAIVADPQSAGRVFAALKEIGASLAMDDFGTGYSNLAYLQKLPIDMLKIDRSFVSGMLADRDKVSIVRAILSLAQALGMQTIAEGVESRELEQTLSALGCTKGQGYLYSRPVGADAAYKLFRTRNQ